MAELTIPVRKLIRSHVLARTGDPPDSGSSPSQHWITVSFLLLAICFSTVCGWVLLEARRATEARAIEVGTSLVNSLRFDIGRNIESLNLSLETVAKNLQLPGVHRLSPEIRRLVLFDHPSSNRYPTSIFVCDASGQIVFDSRNIDPPKQNLSDREHFQAHKDSDSAGLFISRPIVSRVNGRSLVAFSRRLSYPDGSFAGVVVSAMLQDYFEAIFRDISLGPGGSVTLVRTDGVVLMRWPHREGFVGSNIKRAELFAHFPHAPAGHFETRAISDGTKRLFSYSQINGQPLIVVVGQSFNDIFAAWWRQALSIGALVAALCALTVVLAGILNRELARRSAAERKLTILAATDGLTGLANRRQFNKALALEWRRAARNGAPVALLMIDADEFKVYNDSHGHPAGDKLLLTIAASIAQLARRPSDLGARYGGDEFVVLLPDTSLDEAAALAERLRQDLVARCSAEGVQQGGARLSIGVACLVPGRDGGYRELIAAADRALYRAKRLGRNRIEVATTDAGNLAPDADAHADAHRTKLRSSSAASEI